MYLVFDLGLICMSPASNSSVRRAHRASSLRPKNGRIKPLLEGMAEVTGGSLLSLDLDIYALPFSPLAGRCIKCLQFCHH